MLVLFQVLFTQGGGVTAQVKDARHARAQCIMQPDYLLAPGGDKAKDLEVLRSMGMPMGMMQEAFGLQGLVINVVGGLAGVLLGSLIVMGQAQYGWLKLQGSVVPSYPVRLDAMDVLGTLVVVVLVGGLGSSAMVRQLIRRQYAR